MIAEGALMEAHDCHFGTPLHVACARQRVDCVKVLLNSGKLSLVELFTLVSDVFSCLFCMVCRSRYVGIIIIIFLSYLFFF